MTNRASYQYYLVRVIILSCNHINIEKLLNYTNNVTSSSLLLGKSILEHLTYCAPIPVQHTNTIHHLGEIVLISRFKKVYIHQQEYRNDRNCQLLNIKQQYRLGKIPEESALSGGVLILHKEAQQTSVLLTGKSENRDV